MKTRRHVCNLHCTSLYSIYFFCWIYPYNVFLAIINDTYSEVKDDKSLENVDFDIYEVLKKRYKSLLYKINPNMFPPVAHPSPVYKNVKESQTALQHDFERDEGEVLDLTEYNTERLPHRQNISDKYYYKDPAIETITPPKPTKKSDRQITAKDNFLILRTDQLEERMNKMSNKIDWIMEQFEKQELVQSAKQATSDIEKAEL